MEDTNLTGNITFPVKEESTKLNVAPPKSLRNRILESKDIKEEVIEVSEWEGVKILVRGLTGKQRAMLLTAVAGNTSKPDAEKLYPQIMVMCCFDPETREPIFTSADKDSINAKSGIVLERVAQLVMGLSGLTNESMDNLRKN